MRKIKKTPFVDIEKFAQFILTSKLSDGLIPMLNISNKTLPTEAQFEAQLRAAILRAFPWLPSHAISHQRSFSFKFGHAIVTVDAAHKDKASARADVLVLFNGIPLAVFELKRPGVKLTADDDEQGLSYARMLHPRPPLVVVSNGRDTHLLEVHSGQQWQPKSKSETALATLIERSAEVAEADLKRAVEILMGSAPDIWVQAVRQVTKRALENLSGGWNEPLAPFVRNMLFPRKVTSRIVKHFLEDSHRLIIIEGAPLTGKSNILRELAFKTVDNKQLAVLYLDADIGLDLFNRLALIFSDALDWPVTPDEARQWLVRLSRAEGPALVLAIDNVGPDRDDLRRDIEAITTGQFGPGLRVVLAVDDVVAEQITKMRNKRGLSAIGRIAARLRVGPLDNKEFEIAQTYLAERRITFVQGARHSAELRAPWLLRAMAADAVTSEKYKDATLVAAMSPVPGLELIDHARRQFDVSQSPFARYRELAQAVLEDAQDNKRASELVLELTEAFIVRRSTALNHLSVNELQAMLDDGLIREARSQSGENIYVIRLPALMASELARLIAEALPERSQAEPAEAAAWLVGAAGNLPLGDVIAAMAVIDAALGSHGLSLNLIAALRKRVPEREKLVPGMRVIGLVPDVGVMSLTIREDGRLLFEHDGQEQVVEPDEDRASLSVAFSEVYPFLILSHLAGHAFTVSNVQSKSPSRLDPDLLLGVGGTPMILRRPGGDIEVNAVPVHDIGDDLSIVCHEAGIVEPITWSLVRFLGRENEVMRNQFIEHALESPEAALIARLYIALRQTVQCADKARSAWAAGVLSARLEPLLKKMITTYFHE